MKTLLVGPGGGQAVQLQATARSANGDPVPSTEITWSTLSPAVLLSATGLVLAVQSGTAIVVAHAGDVAGEAVITVNNVPAVSLTLSEDAVGLEVGPLGVGTHQFNVELKDSTGAILTGRPIFWSTSSTGIALVSGQGKVTAVGAGLAKIVAAREGRADTASVTVTESDTLPDDADVSILNAQWTQGVQEADGSIPLIRGGRAAVLNVLLTATRSIATPSALTLRLREANGTIAYTSSQGVVVQTGALPTMATPSAQFLVPNAELQLGRTWELIRDPDALLPDSSAADDLLPRGGGAMPLLLVDVPPLKIRFIPVTLSAHANVTGNVSLANIDEYLRIVRQVHPYGELIATVGEPLVSAQVFGAAPTGGGTGFWIPLLSDVDAARVADPTSTDEYWIGIVRPPAGFTFTTYGGFGYTPSNGSQSGPTTRSATLVNVGWFSRESQSRELVAHELGHTLGRMHAPCGGAGGPDANYPRPDGTVGPGGHDVQSWADGANTSATPIPDNLGDIMGYCTPVWSSRYTYGGILLFRGYNVAAARPAARAAPVAPTRVLMIRGTTDGAQVTIDAPVTLDAPPTADDPRGDFVVEGLAADGRTLFSQRVTLGRFDHEDRIRPFAAYIPMNAALEGELRDVRVRGPAGEARRPR